MRREMAEQVERYQVWGPTQLKAEVTRLDAEIKLAQHLKAAAMKAQRRQRKATRSPTASQPTKGEHHEVR